MPTNKGFNGSTFTFGSAVGAVVGISYKKNAAKVKVSSPEDAKQLFVGGSPDETVTIEIRGGTSIDVGDTAAASIAFNDGTNKSLGNCEVFDVAINGSEENPISSSIELGPTPA